MGWEKAFAICLMFASLASAAERKASTVREFRKVNECPATGKLEGPCPGWVVDHVWSLCLGGPDIVDNMRWQPAEESYKKDVIERQMCAMKSKLEKTKEDSKK